MLEPWDDLKLAARIAEAIMANCRPVRGASGLEQSVKRILDIVRPEAARRLQSETAFNIAGWDL